jgi:hypothetical protein
MLPRYWIEFLDAKKIALFVLAIVAIALFWSALPADIKKELFAWHGRRVVSLPLLMFFGWVGGWFIFLFVRGEDLHVSAPVDVQSRCRMVGGLMIAGSLLIAGFFSIAFFV